MRRAFLCVASLALAACSGGEDRVAEVVAEQQLPWAEFVATTIDEYYRRNPEQAVDAGLHQYDGKARDWSLAAAREYADWLRATTEDAGAYSDLEGVEAFERDYLVLALGNQAFWINDTDFLTKNPVAYTGRFGIGVYIDREYAPLDVRLRAYTDYVANLPRLLQQMRDNLEPPLPAPYVEMGEKILLGLAEYLANTVPGLFADVEDEALQRQFIFVNDAAVEAVQQTADWLGTLKATATQDYALGEEVFLRMIRETQGLEITLADLKAAGQADLDRNLETLYTACAEFAPGESTEDCVLKVQTRKPPEGAVGGAARQLPGIRQFIADNDIVSIPGPRKHWLARRRRIGASISLTLKFRGRLKRTCHRSITSRRRIRRGARRTNWRMSPERPICWRRRCTRCGRVTFCSTCTRIARRTMWVGTSAPIHSAKVGRTTRSR